jgi:hypothetical protein
VFEFDFEFDFDVTRYARSADSFFGRDAMQPGAAVGRSFCPRVTSEQHAPNCAQRSELLQEFVSRISLDYNLLQL